jgi:hypothetical protein
MVRPPATRDVTGCRRPAVEFAPAYDGILSDGNKSLLTLESGGNASSFKFTHAILDRPG